MGVMWSPWHGCKKCSPGCLHCYVYFLDKRYDKDSSVVTKSKSNFDLPIKKDRHKNYKIESGEDILTCYTSDFFISDADEWRSDAWAMMKIRSDLNFIIPTKRIDRVSKCLPDDWGDGYDNVTICVTCENQDMADKRIPIFLDIPVKRREIYICPILEYVDITKYLKTGKIDSVSVGGESYDDARECNFLWVEKIYNDCKNNNVNFNFHQTGSNFVMNGKRYKINHNDEYIQAKKGQIYLQGK